MMLNVCNAHTCLFVPSMPIFSTVLKYGSQKYIVEAVHDCKIYMSVIMIYWLELLFFCHQLGLIYICLSNRRNFKNLIPSSVKTKHLWGQNHTKSVLSLKSYSLRTLWRHSEELYFSTLTFDLLGTCSGWQKPRQKLAAGSEHGLTGCRPTLYTGQLCADSLPP